MPSVALGAISWQSNLFAPKYSLGWGRPSPFRRPCVDPGLARLGGVAKRAALLARVGVSQRRGDPNQACLAVSLVAREWLASIGGNATDRSCVMQINGACHAQEG